MTITEPKPQHMASLRDLWKAAFGDSDEFLDMFYTTAYAPQRCRCILDGDKVAAALYWFDCSCEGRKLAYIYAVSTDPGYRNQGLCRRLMADTHGHLKSLGYAGAMLLPQDPGLRKMYATMGYEPCTTIAEWEAEAAGDPIPLTQLTPEDYALRRKDLLPPGSVIQEGENLSYLGGFANFLCVVDTFAVVVRDGHQVICYELLGDMTKAPGILQALGAKSGTFRHPGTGKDFAMCTSFTPDCPKPSYFAFAFD